MKKAYAYLRMSDGMSDNVNRTAIKQLDRIIEAASKNDIEIANTFSDYCTGLLDLSERSGYQDMIDALLESGIDIVIVDGMDRLSIIFQTKVKIIRDFEKEEIKLYTVGYLKQQSKEQSK